MLSATGEMKNASAPVSQNTVRRLKPRDTRIELSLRKTLCCEMAEM